MAGRTPAKIVTIEYNGALVEAKKCNECGEIKPLEKFRKNSNGKGVGGRRSTCRECEREKRIRKYWEDPEKSREILRKSYHKNREKRLKYMREYGKENREVIAERMRQWRKENRDRLREWERNYWAERIEQKREKDRRWREENPEATRVFSQKRRALKRYLPCTLSVEEYKQIERDVFSGRCALTESTDIHIEHFIPLSTGHGGTTRGNCYPMDASLNLSKGDENPFEWIKRPDIREKVDMDKWEKLVEYLAEQNGLSTEDFKKFVYWCFENPRTVEQVKNDGDILSLELWKKEVAMECVS